MLKWSINLFIVFVSFHALSQYTWNWTELDTMPFRTANNAVCEAIVNGEEYVYSFGGIDTSKSYDGIHQRSFKYSVATDSWSEIQELPDTLGKIAAGASSVNGKIYIIGGYHVFANGNELSSDRVHIYNPSTDSYESDGASIPVPIDDHVQCVYKDSLIFIVTGWSNTTNRPEVQIYDTYNDTWSLGTSTPNTGYFKVFGASGYIIGDTLYYHGGTTAGFSFTAQPFMRKGYIDPNDPTNITWDLMADAPGASGYRAACSGNGNTVFWVGGAPTSYNYNGIAYDGTGGVDPSARILHFNNYTYSHTDNTAEPFGVMDLRGIAKLSNNRYIICGGMDTNQVVSNRTFLLENTQLNVDEISKGKAKIFNDAQTIRIEFEAEMKWNIVDMNGRSIRSGTSQSIVLKKEKYESGVYLVKFAAQSIRIRL